MPINPLIKKLIKKKNVQEAIANQGLAKSISTNDIGIGQSTDHRLVYLNPKERARRDLENRHGNNVVKLANASAERLNSTLEA